MLYKGQRKEMSQGYKKTTNNRMELLGVIKAIQSLNDQALDKEVVIFTDSKYVMNAVEKGWVYNWQKKNFKDKANPDLWRLFLRVYPKYAIKFEWVKGHSGNKENERCDVLAKKAAGSKQLLIDKGYESSKDQTSLL